MNGLPLDKVHFSPHALERALDMGLDPADIYAAITTPTNVFTGVKHANATGYQFHEISVMTTPHRFKPGHYWVVTIVWATDEAWEEDLAKGGHYDRANYEK